MRDPVSGQETATGLEPILRDRSIELVVACGLATDYCVKATALDALRLGFEVVVLERAVAAVNLDPQDGARALGELRAAGARVT
jgi:nicotinamidase/pyrazinamidase